MIICHDVNIEGFENFSSLKISSHALERIQSSNISMGHLFKLLREGCFELVSSTQKRCWCFRSGQIDIVVDSVLNVITTLVVTSYQRIFIPPPKLGKVIDNAMKEKLLRKVYVKEKVSDRDKYINEFEFMLMIKKLK